MSESTRRGFLIIAGAGAAAATAGVAIAANAGPAGATPAEGTTETAASGPLVAYVRDARSGRVSVMVGESEVEVSDPELVARLARIAAGKKA